MTDLSPPLRLAKLWISLGWLGIIIVMVLSLIPPLPAPEPSSWLWSLIWLYADKITHFITYFTLMGWFSQIYHSAYHRGLYLLGLSLLGVLLEILQGLGGIRTTDWRDVVSNFMGILLAWQLAKTNLAYLLVRLEAKYCLNR